MMVPDKERFRSTVSPSDWIDLKDERDKYRAMATNAETMAATLRVAIENHRNAMRERFAVTQGDPNEDDLALWAALGPETTGKQPCPCGYGTDGIEYHALDCPKNPASAALNEEQHS